MEKVLDKRAGYFKRVFGERDGVLSSVLRRSLYEDGMPTTQIDDAGGRILQLLISILLPKRVVEIGTLFGYSSILIGRALPPDGLLTSLESDENAVAIARRNVESAGLADRVQVLHTDAIYYLTQEPDCSLDALFVDGAKDDYPTYLKTGYPKLRRGGLIIADDALCWLDQLSDRSSAFSRSEAKGIDRYCRALGRNTSVFSALINSENGLMVSLKL